MKMEIVAEVKHSADPIKCRVWCVNWHHEGSVLITAGEDKSFKLWRLKTLTSGSTQPELLNVMRDEQSRTIRWATFSPCGNYLASASFDATVIIYEHKDNDFEQLTTLEGHENEVKCCQFSQSGDFLATCSRDKTVWVWQVSGGNGQIDDYEVAGILQTHTADVKFVAWHPFEDILVSGGYDGVIAFYKSDGEDWITLQKIEDAHSDTIWSGSFSGGSEGGYDHCLATCGADRMVKVWCEKTDESNGSGEGKLWCLAAERLLPSSKWPAYSVSWNRHNGLIAAGGGDRTVWLLLFDAEHAALLVQTSIDLEAEINCVGWNPSLPRGDLLAAACDDGKVVLLGTCTGQRGNGVVEPAQSPNPLSMPDPEG